MADNAAGVIVDDMAEGMQCMDHRYRSNPGGVCAFCLQEKLGKLVSSSKSTPFFSLHPPPWASSSSPTSFSSDAGAALGLASGRSGAGAGRRSGIPFLGATYIKKKKSCGASAGGYGSGGRKVMAAVATTANFTPAAVANESGNVLKRSKSVAAKTAPAGGGGGGGVGDFGVPESPRKKSFWSFLYLSAASSTTTSSSAAINCSSSMNRRRSTSSSSLTGDRVVSHQQQQHVGVDDARGGASGQAEAESPSGSQASSSFGRKVGRSRSVGCGSRSFSGDFLERISTGFGDCTLRRVESHRESKSKMVLHLDAGDRQRPTMKEQVKCGGLFGGFGLPSSAYAADEGFDSSSMPSSAAVHGARSRTWGWAFASPMRVFRPYSNSSSAPATKDIISSINASDKMASGGGGSKVDDDPSILTVKS